jgi:hypothetical protein
MGAWLSGISCDDCAGKNAREISVKRIISDMERIIDKLLWINGKIDGLF